MLPLSPDYSHLSRTPNHSTYPKPFAVIPPQSGRPPTSRSSPGPKPDCKGLHPRLYRVNYLIRCVLPRLARVDRILRVIAFYAWRIGIQRKAEVDGWLVVEPRPRKTSTTGWGQPRPNGGKCHDLRTCLEERGKADGGG